jgi:hypothetical protein
MHHADQGVIRMKLFTIGVILSLALSVAARGQIVLDQQHSFTSSVANSTNGDVTQVGQTFTVGVAGVLDHVDLFMFRVGGIFDPTGDPLLRVYNTASGLPTGSPLASVIISEALVPLNNAAFVSFDVSSAAIGVTVGDVLAWSVTATSGVGPYFVPTDQGQSVEYTGGAAVINFGPAWQFISPAQDHSFRTFVSATAQQPSADFDEDDDVDGQDFLTWQRGLGTESGATLSDGNANAGADGDVDGDDLSAWRAQFGPLETAPAASAVPEPTAVSLAFLSLTAFLVRRGRR